jgi:heme/copper-type cytochrome/quinol oxidase subunit 2
VWVNAVSIIMYLIIFSQYLPDPATYSMEAIIYFFRDTISFVYVIGFFVFWVIFRSVAIFYNKGNYTLYDYTKYELGNFFFKKISFYAKGVKHFPNVEFIWTVIPALILVVIGIPSFSLLYFIEQFAEPHIILRVEGHQWYWHYNLKQLPPINNESTEYFFDSYMIPSDALKVGQLRLLEVDTKLTLPTMTHIQVITSSVDVLHCWSVPSLGMKLDCCPGRLNETMLFIKRSGIYYGQCSEICGMNHAFMPIVVNCLQPLDFVIINELGLNY